MKSTTNKFGTQTERRELAREKLLDAAVALVAERGLQGFTVAEVELKAGLGRGLVVYHFKTGQALIEAAMATLLEADAGPAGRGLEPLLHWIGDQVQRAANRDARVLATAQLAMGPGADGKIADMRRELWRRVTGPIEAHLKTAEAVQQLRDNLVPSEVAPMLLGQLFGEQLRMVATGVAPNPAFIKFVERGLVADPPSAKTARKTADVAPAPGAKHDLFPIPSPGAGGRA
jgi:AcrR family transcriptional regulator